MNTRKFAASAVALSMIVSMTGCSLLGGGKAKEEVISAADSFASNVCNLKASKVTGAVADIDDDTVEGVEFAFSYISSDDVLSAIAGTLAYEIDEDSVEVDSKKGEASVDVVFTYVDADSVYDDVINDGGDEDAFIDALGDCDDVVEVETTIEFVLEDDEWLVDDSELDCLEDVFAFCEAEYEFGADFMEYYNGYSWYAADSDDTYTNAYYIDFWATYDYSYEDTAEFYFTVEHDGSLVYTSETSYSCDCYFYASDYTGDDYLPEGSYTITLYLADGTMVDSGSTYVYLEDAGNEPGAPVAASGEYADLWADGINEYWYSYSDGSGYAMDSGIYDTSETTIEFTCEVLDEATFADFPVYYEVYYSATGNTGDADLVYSSTIYPTEYSNGYFYEFQYNGTLEAGSYFFAGAESANADAAFFVVEATVS